MIPNNKRGRSNNTEFIFTVLFIILLLCSLASAETVTWANLFDGGWHTQGNWSPTKVPEAGDDVVIIGSGIVTVSSDVTIKSLIVDSLTGDITVTLQTGVFAIDSGPEGSDTPVLTRIGISEATASQSPLVQDAADYYAGLGESISLVIEITNPSGYSISRFKINGTSFTSGSFTTDPIQLGQTTTVIRTGAIFLGNTVKEITYTISDIKYIAEFGQTEKNVLATADSVSSTTVSVGFPGSGTIDDPYLISNPGQLKAVARCTNGNIGGVDGYNGKYLELTSDLDLSGESWIPIGKNNRDGIYTYSFKGTFDGGSKLISNLTVNSSLLWDVGLFGHVYGGTLRNIVLENCHITNSRFNGVAGGIVSSLYNGSISNSSSDGNVMVTSRSSVAAGIVGVMGSNSTVMGCSNSATISSGFSGAADIMAAGGIVGFSWGNSIIQDSYNTGNISAQGDTFNEAGGIGARLNPGSSVLNCYNIGTISVSNTGDSYCTTGAGIVGVGPGAFVGEGLDNEPAVINSVWLDGSAGVFTCVGAGTVAASKSTSDMKLQSTYTDIGWDFSTAWKISPGEYPKLMWQD